MTIIQMPTPHSIIWTKPEDDGDPNELTGTFEITGTFSDVYHDNDDPDSIIEWAYVPGFLELNLRNSTNEIIIHASRKQTDGWWIQELPEAYYQPNSLWFGNYYYSFEYLETDSRWHNEQLLYLNGAQTNNARNDCSFIIALQLLAADANYTQYGTLYFLVNMPLTDVLGKDFTINNSNATVHLTKPALITCPDPPVVIPSSPPSSGPTPCNTDYGNISISRLEDTPGLLTEVYQYNNGSYFINMRVGLSIKNHDTGETFIIKRQIFQQDDLYSIVNYSVTGGIVGDKGTNADYTIYWSASLNSGYDWEISFYGSSTFMANMYFRSENWDSWQNISNERGKDYYVDLNKYCGGYDSDPTYYRGAMTFLYLDTSNDETFNDGLLGTFIRVNQWMFETYPMNLDDISVGQLYAYNLDERLTPIKVGLFRPGATPTLISTWEAYRLVVGYPTSTELFVFRPIGDTPKVTQTDQYRLVVNTANTSWSANNLIQ